ncbi:MAG: hypothetical protein ABI193_10850 [Minicystis sp.]
MSLRASWLLTGALLVAGALAGCNKNDPNALIGSSPSGNCTAQGGSGPGAGGSGSSTTAGSTTTGTGGGTTTTTKPPPKPKTVLDDRVLDYPEALRTASFKLLGNAPTMEQIESLRTTPDLDKPAKYEGMIDEMMNDVRFAKRMIAFWKNTMRMGGAAGGGKPSRDAAPTLAARITVEGRPYTDLFTATEHTCPTFDGTAFADGECPNGPVTAGLLSDAGIHSQYYGNLAFRRVRFFQETFVCRKQPAELIQNPKPIGMNGATYTSPWDFNSIAGTDNGGRIDFHDISSAICANCHTSSNHRGPLFANFDANGAYQVDIQVHVPVPDEPVALMSDWLPQTPVPEIPAWKFGVPTKDLAELGAAMAKDDEVLGCAVKRVWNYAMSKGDIVNDAADVPTEVIAPLNQVFKDNGYNLRKVIRAAFVHDDFVRF